MYRKNSDDQERGEGRTLGAWEGKIKGRGTSSRARHCLHIGFAGTALLRDVLRVTLSVAAASNFRVLGPPIPAGA
jgi:hypothetical protein